MSGEVKSDKYCKCPECHKDGIQHTGYSSKFDPEFTCKLCSHTFTSGRTGGAWGGIINPDLKP